MDIPSLSIQMSKSELATDVGIGVLKMIKEDMIKTGAQLTEMMDAIQVYPESTIDISV